MYISSKVRPKDKFQDGKEKNGYKKAKHAKLSEKPTFPTPLVRTYVYVCLSGGKIC